jgi:DNA mismatch repair ATPase MutL
VGRKFTFNSAGDVTASTALAMNTGTTIVAKNLFHNIPVRRNLYKKGSKKNDDLKKVEYLCRAYAVIW